jgi:hypothetical protein
LDGVGRQIGAAQARQRVFAPEIGKCGAHFNSTILNGKDAYKLP